MLYPHHARNHLDSFFVFFTCFSPQRKVNNPPMSIASFPGTNGCIIGLQIYGRLPEGIHIFYALFVGKLPFGPFGPHVSWRFFPSHFNSTQHSGEVAAATSWWMLQATQRSQELNDTPPLNWLASWCSVRSHGILLVNHSLLWWVNFPSFVAATAVVQHRYLEFGPKRWPWRGALCGIDPHTSSGERYQWFF